MNTFLWHPHIWIEFMLWFDTGCQILPQVNIFHRFLTFTQFSSQRQKTGADTTAKHDITGREGKCYKQNGAARYSNKLITSHEKHKPCAKLEWWPCSTQLQEEGRSSCGDDAAQLLFVPSSWHVVPRHLWWVKRKRWTGSMVARKKGRGRGLLRVCDGVGEGGGSTIDGVGEAQSIGDVGAAQSMGLRRWRTRGEVWSGHTGKGKKLSHGKSGVAQRIFQNSTMSPKVGDLKKSDEWIRVALVTRASGGDRFQSCLAAGRVRSGSESHGTTVVRNNHEPSTNRKEHGKHETWTG